MPRSLEQSLSRSLSVSETSSLLDDDLTRELQTFIRAALREGFYQLKYGTPEIKNRLVNTVVTTLTRSITKSSSTATEEIRISFESLLNDMTNVPSHIPLVTETDILDVAVDAPLEDFDDQDEANGLHSFGLGAADWRPDS